MSASSWRAALRIARREAWRAKARSLLVIALIGLPVFVLATADIVYRTWQLEPADKIQRAIGAADAGIQFPACGAVQQAPHGWLDGYACGSGGPVATPTAAELAGLLPKGTRLIEERKTNSEVQVRTAAGLKNTQLTGLDYADPIARGLLHQDKGRAPVNVHEVSLTTALAESVKLGVGDTLRMKDPGRSYRVVGIVSDASHRDAEMIYTLPAAVTPANDSGGDSITWLIHSPGPITWTQVRRLNKAGYLVLSRSVYLNPPPKSQVAYQSGGPGFASLSKDAVGVVALVGGMALLEIVLLAGPAFAVGARRQRRDLALVAAVGGRRRDLRNVVLSAGVVLGLTAGVIAVLGGVAAAAGAVPVMRRVVDDVPGSFDPHPFELAVITLVSLLTALAAAAFPARGAARTDVVAALAGRRGAARTRKRVPVSGAVLAAAGVVVAVGGATVSTGWTVILAGVVLVELGLIICTPALLGLVARAGRHLPLSPRIALRDAGRNRSAATPAVAAVMASVIGAVAIVIGVSSSNDQDRRNYQPSLPGHDGYVSLDAGNNVAGRAPDVVAALRSGLPADQVVVVHGPQSSPRSGCGANADPCIISYANLIAPTGPGGQQTSRYRGGSLPPLIVDDGSGVNALFGTPEPAAAAALRAGNVVVVDPGAVRDGKVRIEMTSDIATRSGGDKPGKARTLAFAATAVTGGYPITQLIVPPSVAKTLALQVVPMGVLAQTTRQPTDHEQQVVNGRLDKIDATLRLEVETGYHDPHGWLPLALIAAAGLLAVAAAVIATALANVDSRSDLVTLAAVGASPRTRRLLSMSRAAVIAGVGTAIGVVAGFVPPVAWVHASHRVASYSEGGSYFEGGQGPALRLVVPWLPIAVAFVAVPVVAALVAGLFSRSRLPSERHPE